MEVYADQPRETWVVRDGQYVGTVDPLDVGALVQLAGDTAWAGLPSGTTIGHVHLYVGDLDRAAEFYHVGLGFDQTGSFPGALFVAAGGYHHHVGLNVWAAGAPVATDADARLLEWELILPDRADLPALSASLARVSATVECAGNDVLASDPWRIVVRATSAVPEQN